MSLINQPAKLNPRFRNFCSQNLHFFACVSALAYKGKTEHDIDYKARVKETLDVWSFPANDRIDFIFNAKTDTELFIASTNRDTVIAVRGSESELKDWLNNFTFGKRQWDDEDDDHKAHAGFYKCYKSVRKKIDAHLNAHPNKRIWICGHSLGGAITNLITAHVVQHHSHRLIAGVYTYGQPRAMSFKFAGWLNDAIKNRYIRCVNNSDIVTRVPPQIMNFSHVGTLVYFDADGDFRKDRKLSWWARFWDRLEGRLGDFMDKDLSPDALEDHTLFRPNQANTYVNLSLRTRYSRNGK